MSRSSHQLFIASLGIASLVACQSEIPRPFVGQVTTADASVGGAFDASVRGAPETSDPYADQVKPKVALDDTAAITTAAAVLTISGQAVDNVGVTAVMIRAGVNVPRPVSFQFDSGAFAIPVQLAVGVQVIEVTAYDAAGNIGTATRSVTRTVTKKDTAPPKLVVSTPKSGFEVHGGSIAVKGTASDDVALASVTVQVGTAAAKTAETSDNFANWWLQAKLLTGSQQTLTVRATDLAGKSAQVVIVGSTTNVVDIEPPFVTVQAPADGHKTASDSVLVKGIAKDASGIASVEIRVGGGPYQPALSNDGFMHFQRVVVLAPGANVIRVRVRDNSGLQTLVKRTVHNTSIDQWGMPKVVTLGYKAALYNSSAFTLDKAGVKSLFPPDKAAQIELMQLDVSTLMQNTLKQLRDACGKGWNKKNSLDKNCPKDWGLAEVNLWRLLTMTPNNVNVAGTSIEGVKEMATTLSSWGLLDSFDEVLALGLGIGKYDLIVAEKPVAEAMVATIIASHPNTTSNGQIPVSLHDGLTDMVSLGAHFDKVGSHPGFLDKTKPPTSKLLTSSFQMKLTAVSNLHWHDGVALSLGKSYLALLADKKGPTYDDVLEFDFLDPNKFSVSGLAVNPTVDLTLKASEHPGWIAVGTKRAPLPKGNGKAWSISPWYIEHMFVDAVYRQYKNHRVGCDLCKGKSKGALLWEVPVIGLDEAELVVGRKGYSKGGGKAEHFPYINPNPAGWLRIWTLFGLGKPPKSQYVWDMVLEVAQRRLLDGGVQQGKASVRLSVKNVPVGITGAQIKAKLTPSMHQQRSKLSKLLMGDYQSKVKALDFYLAKGKDGALRLYFAHPSDPLAKALTAHAKRGFFADEKLSKKVSSTASGGSGDFVHEKLSLGKQPQTVYCSDVSGNLYRLQVGALSLGQVTVTFRKWLGKGS